MLHRRIGLWVQPGGHLESGDRSVAAAAAREVAEETGLAGTVLTEIACLSRHFAPCAPDVDWHLDVQFVLVAEPGEPIVSIESDDARWWDVSSLPRELAPGVRDGLNRAMEVATAAAGAPATPP